MAGHVRQTNKSRVRKPHPEDRFDFPKELEPVRKRLTRYIRRLTKKDSQLAHDAFQHMFMQFHQEKPKRALIKWAKRVTSNFVFDQYRKHCTVMNHGPRVYYHQYKIGPSACDSAVRKENARIVQEEVMLLRIEWQQILELSEVLVAAKIAAELGLTIRAVRLSKARALAALRRRLLGRFGGECEFS